MTQRESKVPGSATIAVPQAAADALRSRPGADRANRSSLWEDIFRTVTPAQRTELLALAGRQGFLYAHQVPDGVNGKKAAEDAGRVQRLTELLRGPCPQLPPVRSDAFTPWDDDLDLLQREAVARALATPDLCVVAGLPGTGKSRVVSEILTQAAARGLRVLFLAPGAAAIERVLEQVVQRDVLFPVLCLEPAAKPEALPEALRPLTISERLRMVREALAGAMRGKDTAEQRCQQRRREEALWPELGDLAAAAEDVARREQVIRQRLAAIPGEVAAEAAQADGAAAGAFAADLAAEKRRHTETLAEITAAQAQVERARDASTNDLNSLIEEAGKLRPLALAKEQRRWWSPAWWRATLRGRVAQHLLGVEQRIASAQDAVAAANDEANVLRGKRQTIDEDHRCAVERIMEAESKRRQASVLDDQTAVAQEAKLLREKWQVRLTDLEPETRPDTMTAAAVEAARNRWHERLRHDEETCKFAGQWLGFLQESSESLAGRLPALANLLAGTLSAVAADKHFAAETFDLLVLEDANQVAEADLLKWAKRARRWVLVGELPLDSVTSLPLGAQSAVNPAGPCFQRLWQHCVCDPRRLPYAWILEGERLCCRLRSVEASQRQLLESERVADFPDIELRILNVPRRSPVLAEVVFPPSMSINQAKEYIYRELQELAIQTAGCNGCWLEEPERLIFHLADMAHASAASVALENGVRELLIPSDSSPVGWQSCRLEFDKDAGWNWDRAADWLHNHLEVRDPGRAAYLQAPYRMQPGLRAIVADLLFGDGALMHADARPHVCHNGQACAVVFVPVPGLARKDGADGKPGLLPGEGAGLELDLAGPRTRDRLPAEVRTDLPRRGFVNYQEARAIVRRLEKIVSDPPTAAAAGRPAAIAVLALHAAQAELLRSLIHRSSPIRRSTIPVEVGVPGAFCHREFSLVLVSLTRSQTQRAVAFVDEMSQLMLALTRARTQVILFGDPGALVRRSHWQGRLDQLDETAAGHEARVIKHLVRYLQGRGKLAQAFHLCNDEC